MSKYGDVIYGGSRYGATPKLSYSVEPMSLDVVQFGVVNAYFQAPAGTFTRVRLVRNQSGFPETAEDGVIVFEQGSMDGSSLEGHINLPYVSSLGHEFRDGIDNPDQPAIASGKNIYYSVFLYTGNQIWVNAGNITDVIPANSGVTDKMINLMPRVLTSSELTPLGVVDENSDLYKFLDGFGFTYEEWLTRIALIRPSHNLEESNYSTIPGEFLNLGLTPEPNLPVVNQRRLIREAIYLYSQKGTKAGLSNYIESLTGFAPTISLSVNQMLSIQDSTFFQGIGNWTGTNAVIESSTPNGGARIVDGVIDTTYAGKVTTSASNAVIKLGVDSPLTKGVVVNPNVITSYSCVVMSPTSAGDVTLSYEFYNKDANLLNYTYGYMTVSATPTWKSVHTISTTSSPFDAAYAVLKVTFSNPGVYYVDQFCVQDGSGGGNPPVYDEARAVNIVLAPKKTNYIENPSFEVDASGWTLTNLTFSQDPTNYPMEGYPSLNSGKFTMVSDGVWVLANTSKIPVDPGTWFNVSMFAYSMDLPGMDMYIDVYDADDNLLTSFSDSHMMGMMWMRHFVRGLIDLKGTADHAHVRFTGTGLAGQSFALDMIQAEDTYSPTDYFDGSMPVVTGALWAGTANASVSYLYPNKEVKFTRLKQTLNYWMPPNMFWRVSTPAGLEYNSQTV
jgi:hypothetical protein